MYSAGTTAELGASYLVENLAGLMLQTTCNIAVDLAMFGDAECITDAVSDKQCPIDMLHANIVDTHLSSHHRVPSAAEHASIERAAHLERRIGSRLLAT
jgi:hypothetical protein